MFLPPFELHRPRTLQEALDLLRELEDDDPALYLGGTELLLLMKLGLAAPGHLIDAKRIEELRGISMGDDEVTIGAATTHRELELHRELGTVIPTIGSMAAAVANVRVRNVGTLGGNLCFAEPHSDPAPMFTALGAVAEVASMEGRREVPLEGFFLGPLMTTLEEGEVLLRLRFPRPPEGAVIRYRRLAFGDRPTVSVAAVGHDRLRLVIGAVGPVPVLVDHGELTMPTDDATIDAVAEHAGEVIEPIADANGSVDYKRHLTRVLVRRTLRGAE